MINNIYLPGHFFIKLAPHIVNFRHNQLQNDVHLSFSFGEDNTHYNFHVSRNTNHPAGKPQIVVFKISKEMAQQAIARLGQDMFQICYQPLNISYHQGLSRRRFAKQVKILPLGVSGKTEASLKKVAGSCSLRRRSKLEIDPLVIEKLRAWAASSGTQKELVKQFRHLPWEVPAGLRSGYLISPRYQGIVLLVAGKYYKFNADIDLLSIAAGYLEPGLVKKLVFKTLLATARVSRANSAADTRKYYDPVMFG